MSRRRSIATPSGSTAASTNCSATSTADATRTSTPSTSTTGARQARPQAALGRSTVPHRTEGRFSITTTATTTCTPWSRARRATSRSTLPSLSSTLRMTRTSSSHLRRSIGWTKDSASVLLTDKWDVWQVPVNGGAAVNLTGNGRKDQIRYQRASDRARRRGRHRSRQAAVLRGLRRVDEEGRHRAHRAREDGRRDAQLADASFATVLKAKAADRTSTRARRRPSRRLLHHRRHVQGRSV